MDVKGYLKQAMKLEILVYEQSRVVSNMQRTVRQLQNPQPPAYQKECKYDFSGLSKPLFWSIFFGAVGGALFVCFKMMKSEIDLDYDLQNRVLKLGTFVGAFLGSLVPLGIVIFEVLSTNRYNHKVKQNNLQMDKNHQALQLVNQNKINALTQQLTKTQDNLRITRNLLSKLYSYNVIHPKYRSLVPMSMMCEYFDTGRCSSLTGHGGAYDVYENELRQNIIIGKLDVIIQKMDEIVDNQYMLHQALVECNNNISKVNSNLKSLQSTNDEILECSQVTAYNSRISAVNTSAMSAIAIYEHLK